MCIYVYLVCGVHMHVYTFVCMKYSFPLKITHIIYCIYIYKQKFRRSILNLGIMLDYVVFIYVLQCIHCKVYI